MKKFINLFICVFILAIAFPVVFTLFKLGVFAKEPEVKILNKFSSDAPVLRVVADFDFAPYSFYTNKNKISGLDIELLNEIANRLEMKVDMTFTTWQTCKNLLQTQQADLILGLEIFSHMGGVLKTIPTSVDDLVVFGKNKVFGTGSLKDKKVGLMVNSIVERIFDLNCEYVDFFTNSDIMAALEKGTIDFGICHGSVGQKIIEKYNYKIYPNFVLMKSYPAIGVREDLPELREKISNIIGEMSAEGLIKELDDKWIYGQKKYDSILQMVKENFEFYMIYTFFFMLSVSLFGYVIIDTKHREEKYLLNVNYQNSLKNIDEMQKEKDRLIEISTLDNLTGLYNHRAYAEKIDDLKKNMIHTVSVISFDLNGLKTANDTLGHFAGDELISAAGKIIYKNFSPIGDCFRTGGDEFVVISEMDLKDSNSSFVTFVKDISEWKGKVVKSMAVSFGVAASSEIENFSVEKLESLINLADKRMYKNKNDFYKKSGIARR